MNLLKDNWTYAKVSDFAELLRGISYKKDESRKESQKGYKPMLRSNNINYELNFIDLVYVPEKKIKSIQFIKEGDIIFAMSSGSKHLVGKSAQSKCNYDGSYGAFCGLLRVSNLMNKKYVGLFFKSQEYRKYISRISKGTNINNLKRDHILEIDFPLAPLNEQNRIVEKIEEIFSDLDKATEDLKKTQEQLKIYRQAVLKDAFEGKLTEEWCQTRKEASNIKHTTLNNICIKAEKIKNEENSERKIKYLDIGSIDNKVFKIVSHKTYQIKDAPSRAKQIVKEGDTLFSTVRTYLKNIAYVHSEYDNEICSTGFCVIRPKKDVLSSKYLFYYVISDDFVNRVSPLQTGTSYPAVRDDDILKQKIPLITIDEQEQIIQEIESRLSVCDKIEETIEHSLNKIEYLRRSILKKAFKGKLVPQNPNDEPAEKLLERIKQEKEKFESNNKKRKKI